MPQLVTDCIFPPFWCLMCELWLVSAWFYALLCAESNPGIEQRNSGPCSRLSAIFWDLLRFFLDSTDQYFSFLPSSFLLLCFITPSSLFWHLWCFATEHYLWYFLFGLCKNGEGNISVCKTHATLINMIGVVMRCHCVELLFFSPSTAGRTPQPILFRFATQRSERESHATAHSGHPSGWGTGQEANTHGH